jgi:hypothetical protein
VWDVQCEQVRHQLLCCVPEADAGGQHTP